MHSKLTKHIFEKMWTTRLSLNISVLLWTARSEVVSRTFDSDYLPKKGSENHGSVPYGFKTSPGQRPSATLSTLSMAWLPMINFTGEDYYPILLSFNFPSVIPPRCHLKTDHTHPLAAAVMKPLIIYVTFISHGIIKSAISHRLAFVILNEISKNWCLMVMGRYG